MTTSGVTAWSLTARDIIATALQEGGIIPLGDDAEADEAEACLVRLNGLLKSWRIGNGLLTQASVITTPNVASVTLDDAIESVISVRLVQSATNERMLWPWTRDEYYQVPNRATSGSPTIYYTDEQRDASMLYVWPVPTTAMTLKVDYQRMPETVTNLNETVDFPQKYNETLYANLAVRCWGIFNSDTPPPAELVARANYLERMMFDRERPTSYIMEPAF